MLLRFHVGTQTGRSQTWRRKRKSPELHTKITEYSKQDFNQKRMINSKTRGNKPLPLSTADLIQAAEPHLGPHSGPTLSRASFRLDYDPRSTSDTGDLPEGEGWEWPQGTTARPSWCRIRTVGAEGAGGALSLPPPFSLVKAHFREELNRSSSEEKEHYI